jgi:hypothetical protein
VKVPLMQQQQQQLSRQWLQKSGVIYPLIHDTRLQVAAAAALEDKTDEEDMTSLEIPHGYDCWIPSYFSHTPLTAVRVTYTHSLPPLFTRSLVAPSHSIRSHI